MKKVMFLVCAAAAAMMAGQQSVQAQCGVNGGFNGGGFNSGFGGGFNNGFGGGFNSGLSYSSYSPRSSFSIGYTSVPRVGYRRSAYRVPVSRSYYRAPSRYNYYGGRSRYRGR